MIQAVKLNFKVMVDTGCKWNPYITKKTNMHAYKEVYFGAEWPIHFKFSDALNITFLAMFYGIGMPIMFPMAAIILANQRLCERVVIWKYSRQPPSMDDAMCKSIIQILKFAPILFLFNNYWLMDSKLFFDNKWQFKMKVTDNIMSSHLVAPTINQAAPLLYVAFIAAFIFILKKVAHD
jgi:hypothetical protein